MKKILVVALGLCSLTFAQVVHAGTDGSEAAKGLLIGEIMNEKCTGIKPPPSQQQKINRALTAQGISDEEIKQGFSEGVIYAEFSHPQKPSRAECREAAKVHQATLGFIH